MQFKLAPRRLCDHQPALHAEHFVSNQIDYILDFDAILSCSRHIPTDHILLACILRLELEKINKDHSRNYIALRKLNNINIRHKLKHEINTEIKKIKTSLRVYETSRIKNVNLDR